MSKYRFSELKKTSKDSPLPVDCNDRILEIVKLLFSDDKALVDSIKKAQDEKWYGTLFYYGDHGEVKAYIEFSYGMAIYIKPVKKLAKNIEFHRNLRNETILFKKEREE